MSDQFENHFANLAPSPAESDDSPDLTDHFTAMAPQAEEGNQFAQDKSLARYPKMALHAASVGAAAALGLPGSLESTIWPGYRPTLPTIGEMVNYAQGGDVKGPAKGTFGQDVVPQNALERYGSAAVAGIPIAAATVASGGAALPALASNIGANLAAEGAHDAFPNLKWAPAAAAILFSLGTGLGASWLENNAKVKNSLQVVNEAEQRLREAQQVAEAASAPEAKAARLAGPANALSLAKNEASSEKIMNAQMLASVKARSAAALQAVKQAAEDTVSTAWDKAKGTFDTIADTLGDSKTYQQAGAKMQEALRDWKKNVMPAEMANLKAPLQAIPANAADSNAGFLGVYNRIDKANLLNRLDLPDSLRERVQASLGSGGAEALTGEAMPSGLSWADGLALRSAIGDAMSKSRIVNDIGQNDLKALYAAKTADLRSVAAAHGLADEFDRFNAGTSDLYDFASGPASRFITTTGKGETIKGGLAAKKLLSESKVDASDLAALRTRVPGAVDELAAAHLRDAGPDGWAEFGGNRAAQEALVPPGAGPTVLDSAVADHGQAVVNSKQLVTAEAAKHAERMQAAAEDAQAGNAARTKAVAAAQAQMAAARARDAQQAWERGIEVKRAREALELAQAGVPQKAGAGRNLTHALRSGAGALIGHSLANALIPGSGWAATGLETAGALAPRAFGGIKNALSNPTGQAAPLTGYLAGQNALVLDPRAVEGP